MCRRAANDKDKREKREKTTEKPSDFSGGQIEK